MMQIALVKAQPHNFLAINKNIVWNSWGSNYKYAKFGASIILSEEEQEGCIYQVVSIFS